MTRTARGVVLRQAGEALELQVEASVPFSVEIEDVSKPQNPQDSPNPDLKRIVIRLQTAAKSTGNLKVTAIPAH